MPRRQKQKQTQKQTVIVNIREPKKKRSTRRRKSAPRDGVSSMQQALPPPVIYQSTYSIPYPVQAPPPIQVPMKVRDFIDVGQVGTEGAVEILDVPTKKEQQSEMTTPVPSQMAGFADTERIARESQKAFAQVQKERIKMEAPQSQVKVEKVDDLAILRAKVAEKEAGFKQMAKPQMEIPQIVKGFTEYPVEKLPIEKQIPVDREAMTAPSRYKEVTKQRGEKMTPDVMAMPEPEVDGLTKVFNPLKILSALFVLFIPLIKYAPYVY